MTTKSLGQRWRIIAGAAALALGLFGCTATEPVRKRPAEPRAAETRVVTTPRQTLEAPWEMRSSLIELRRAEDAVSRGALAEAIAAFAEVEQRAADTELRQAAFVRRIATLLKLGRSREVLDEVSRAAGGRPIEEFGPEVALVVAFAYEHERDIDQTLAWLSLAHRLGGPARTRQTARSEALRLVRKVQPLAFEEYATRWTSDAFVSAIFAEERAWREQGRAAAVETTAVNWFAPETYGASGVPPTPVATPSLTRSAIGVLLPLTGQYAPHGLKAQRGIELAQPAGEECFRFIDTGGDPAIAVRQYEALAPTSAAVLGPLLAKEGEAVASRSKELKTPLITFTKKPGVTALSPAAFRLGVTAEGQVRELLGFLETDGRKRIAVVAGSDAAAEFIEAFRSAKSADLGLVRFRPADEASISGAAAEIARLNPQVVFFADALESAVPLIALLRAAGEYRIVGSASWDDAALIRANAAVLEGAVYPAPFFAQSSRPAVIAFVGSYRERFQEEPTVISAQAFDAARLLLVATAEGEGSVADRLRSQVRWEGVTGELTVGAGGEISRRMSIIEIRNGRGVEIISSGVPTGGV